MASRRIPRPVRVDPPSARAAFVDPATGVLTPHGLKAISFLRDRTGGDYDGIWATLGLAVTGLTQVNQVNQRVSDVEAATATVQGAIAGLRGDPRLEDAVKALEIAIVALVQVQARASGEADRRIGDLDRLVGTLGARLTKAQQALQFQAVEAGTNNTAAQVLQTSVYQRWAATISSTDDQVSDLQNEIANLTTTDVPEGTREYFTDARARDALSGSGAIDYDDTTGVIDLPTRAGWTAATGAATRSTFDTATVTLPQLAERVKALLDDLTTSNIIGA